jgi:DNA-directed RNA polymerase subunit H (RpoH/RPB5)
MSSSSQTISSSTVSSIFKSRNTLLQLLRSQGFDVDEYTEYGVNEVQTMYDNDQLDMLLTTRSDVHPSKKVYVKYHLAKTLRRENINNYTDDLFQLDQVLTKNDTLLIVMKQEINDTMMKILNEIWEKDGIFIVIQSLDRLQFNILEHEYVPQHTILTDKEVADMMTKYNVNNFNELPSISRYDPVAMAIGMRPGQICSITRPSRTAINSTYYRYCQ